MPSKSKQKGTRFEREIVNRAKDLGMEAERAYGSNGKALGEHDEVDGKINNFRFQAKSRKKLVKMLQEAQELLDNDICEFYIVKQDRKEPLAILRLDLLERFLLDMDDDMDRLQDYFDKKKLGIL